MPQPKKVDKINTVDKEALEKAIKEKKKALKHNDLIKK